MFLHYVQVKQVESQRANMSPHTVAYLTARGMTVVNIPLMRGTVMVAINEKILYCVFCKEGGLRVYTAYREA